MKSAEEKLAIFGFKMFCNILGNIITVFIRAFIFMWYNWVLFQYPHFSYCKALLLSILFIPVFWLLRLCGIRFLGRIIMGIVVFVAVVATVLYWANAITLPLFHIVGGHIVSAH